MSIKISSFCNKEFIPPTVGSKYSAGLDIATPYDFTLPPLSIINGGGVGRMIINTGFKIELPPQTYGRIAPRSGLAVKRIDVGAGVIDNDYRGEIGVILYNYSTEPKEFKKGDRIAQLIITPYITPIVEIKDELDETERGCGGFGSTGN